MKKITAFLLILIVLAGAFVFPASAAATTNRTIDKKGFATNYPFVFVHGMGGWGESNSYYDKSPYWGGGLIKSDTDMIKILRAQGINAYAAQVGSFNSAWDRACELYAQLTGTVVDYGEAHSKTHKHDRYGFSYVGKALMGTAWNPKQKINLVGHSFGGATIRLFTSLMTYGAPKEVRATGNSTSELFKGGHNSIHSCVTLSSPHNGTPLCNMVCDLGVPLLFLSFSYNFMGATSGNYHGAFSLQMSHFGLTPAQGKKVAMLNPVKAIKYFGTDDNAFRDMTISGARKLNETIRISPDTYYYSYTAAATAPTGLGGKQKLIKTARSTFNFTAGLISLTQGMTFDSVKMTGNWLIHDGVVPLASALYPECDKYTATDYESAVARGQQIQKGRWYYMDTLYGMDHFDFCGTEDYPTSFEDFYFSIIETVNSR